MVPGWLGSAFGRTVVLKLAAFALVLMVSAVHDFVVGPRAAAAIERDAASPETASLLGRLNALLALALVAIAVALVRGWPA